MFIIKKKNPSQTEIGEHSGITSASVNWHIKRFEDAKIIDENREGRFKHYKLPGDSKLIVATLKNFYLSVWDRRSNGLAEMFLSMCRVRLLRKCEWRGRLMTDFMYMPIWLLLSWLIYCRQTMKLTVSPVKMVVGQDPSMQEEN
jgi:DNA-binding transcriptional ArsR family regulator